MLFLPRAEGQGLVEYALILVLVALIVLGHSDAAWPGHRQYFLERRSQYLNIPLGN